MSAATRRLVAELCYAALVGSYGISGSGDGTANDNVVGADLLGCSGSHNTLLVADVAVSETDAGGDGQELLTAAAVDLAGFQGGADNAVRPAFLAVSA